MSMIPPHDDEPRYLVAGDRLDRYELLCPIAEGGMASVWLANQSGKYGFQKRVAIKTILPSYASDPSFRTMFLDESRLASRVHHENVAQVLDLGEEGNVLYLVIECVDGDSLRALERAAMGQGRPLPQELLLRALADTCAGLHAAHELTDDQGRNLGVVHRDVSPQNILISADGGTKVIDFGIAKARHRLAKETTPGIVKGKQQYMAPEQALGLPVDRRADIWGVGAVFYRLMTGKVVFEAANPIATMDLLRRGKLADPLGLRADVHPAICEVMEKALAPQAKHRFATAADMRDALETAMVKAGKSAGPKELHSLFERYLGGRRAARHIAVRVAVEAATKRAQSRPAPISRPSRCVTMRPGAYRITDAPEVPAGRTWARDAQ